MMNKESDDITYFLGNNLNYGWFIDCAQ
jgi:hypothetical protein